MKGRSGKESWGTACRTGEKGGQLQPNVKHNWNGKASLKRFFWGGVKNSLEKSVGKGMGTVRSIESLKLGSESPEE